MVLTLARLLEMVAIFRSCAARPVLATQSAACMFCSCRIRDPSVSVGADPCVCPRCSAVDSPFVKGVGGDFSRQLDARPSPHLAGRLTSLLTKEGGKRPGRSSSVGGCLTSLYYVNCRESACCRRRNFHRRLSSSAPEFQRSGWAPWW